MGNCCCCNSRSASDRLDSYSGFGLSLASSAKREPPCVSHAYLLLDSARPGHIQLSPAGRRQFAQDSCWSEYQLCIYFSGKLFGLFKCWLAGFFANVYYNTAWSTARVEVDLVSYKANRIIYTDAVFFHLCFSYLSTLSSWTSVRFWTLGSTVMPPPKSSKGFPKVCENFCPHTHVYLLWTIQLRDAPACSTAGS